MIFKKLLVLKIVWVSWIVYFVCASFSDIYGWETFQLRLGGLEWSHTSVVGSVVNLESRSCNGSFLLQMIDLWFKAPSYSKYLWTGLLTVTFVLLRYTAAWTVLKVLKALQGLLDMLRTTTNPAYGVLSGQAMLLTPDSSVYLCSSHPGPNQFLKSSCFLSS